MNKSSTKEETAWAVKPLTLQEQVLRHQLNILAYAAERACGNGGQAQNASESGVDTASEAAHSGKWSLLPGTKLHAWQVNCREKWFAAGGRGVVKVVTGAGKTVLACSIVEKLHNEIAADLDVAIVVPTVVLLDQWHERLTNGTTLPAGCVGRLGGGYSDALGGSVRILVCVLNSAAAKLPRMGGSGRERLLLIVDECHRAGAAQMSQVFATPRKYTLGLSATPERDDPTESDDESDETPSESDAGFDESLLGRELGPIIFEFDYRQALAAGNLSHFTIQHYGLPLEPAERARYDRMSRDISTLRRQLQGQMKGGPMDGGALVGWARRVAARGASNLSRQAAEYVQLTGQRKQLLYHAKARSDAVLRLVANALASDPNSRIILFHESITQVMRLFELLRGAGHPVVAEHSELPDSIRQESIRLFRSGAGGVLVSARSLIEGFDVPAADVGIVVASSSSVRQRVQTLGRILRKKSDDGGERMAVLHVLYMAQTTDEFIYEKEHWDRITGAERNRYFVWDPTAAGSSPAERPEPPRKPKPSEHEVDWSALSPGEPYPGAYEGLEYSCDSQGNVKDAAGRLMSNGGELPALVKRIRGTHGRFRITPARGAVLVVRQEGEGSQVVLAGFHREPLVVTEGSDSVAVPPGEMIFGDDYPKPIGKPVELKVQSKAAGPVLARKRPGGEAYARTSATASDYRCGEDAEAIIQAVLEMGRRNERRITKVKLDPATGVVFCEVSGRRLFLHKLNAGIEFADEVLRAP